MKIISNGDGTGRPKNPNKKTGEPTMDGGPRTNPAWKLFNQNNPPLPIYKDGKPYMEVGEVECELVDQVKFRRLDKWRDFEYGETHEKFNQDDRETRQIYRVLPSESDIKDVGDAVKEEKFPYVRESLLQAKKLIESILSDEIELTEWWQRHIAKKAAEMIRCGCQCDDYNGFDCGCSKRLTIHNEALNELQNLKS